MEGGPQLNLHNHPLAAPLRDREQDLRLYRCANGVRHYGVVARVHFVLGWNMIAVMPRKHVGVCGTRVVGYRQPQGHQ